MTAFRNGLQLFASAMPDPDWRKTYVRSAMKWTIVTYLALLGTLVLQIFAPHLVAPWYRGLFFKVSAPSLICWALVLVPPVVITLYRVFTLASKYKARYNAATPFGDHIFSTVMMQDSMAKRVKNGAPERALCQNLVQSFVTGTVEEVLCRFLFTLPLAMIAAVSPQSFTDFAWLTMFVSSIIFTMLHTRSTLFELGYRFYAGIILFNAFMYYGLLAAIVLHIAHNAASSLSSYIAKKVEAKRLDAGTGIYRL